MHSLRPHQDIPLTHRECPREYISAGHISYIRAARFLSSEADAVIYTAANRFCNFAWTRSIVFLFSFLPPSHPSSAFFFIANVRPREDRTYHGCSCFARRNLARAPLSFRPSTPMCHPIAPQDTYVPISREMYRLLRAAFVRVHQPVSLLKIRTRGCTSARTPERGGPGMITRGKRAAGINAEWVSRARARKGDLCTASVDKIYPAAHRRCTYAPPSPLLDACFAFRVTRARVRARAPPRSPARDVFSKSRPLLHGAR